MPVSRLKYVFSSCRNESVDRSSFSSVGNLFHARSAATQNALSPIVDVSAAQRGRHTTKRTVQIVQECRQLVSVSPRCSLTCVQEATCGLVNTICTEPSPLLVTSATLGELESHDHAAIGPWQYVLRHAGLAETMPVWKLEDQLAQRYSSRDATGQVQ